MITANSMDVVRIYVYRILVIMSLDIADSLSVQRVQRPVEAFVRQVKVLLKPKLKSIFVRKDINSKHSVLRNVYQNYLFVAMKVHVYLRELRHSKMAIVRPELIIKAIDESILFVSSLLLSSYEHLPVNWLAYHAFYTIFSSKPTAYKGFVLKRLRDSLIKSVPHRPWDEDYDTVLSSGEMLLRNILY